MHLITLSMLNRSNNNLLFGYTANGWESVHSAFEQNLTDGHDIGAGLCIYHRGKCVVDLCGGWKDVLTKKEPYTPDTLQLVFSTSKGIIAAAVALCVEKGWLDYDTPVAKYWPEFAAHEKQNITVSDLLAHRAGLSYIDDELTADDGYNWSRVVSLLAAQKPHWTPGTAHGYHAYTLGYLAGELIRRVDPQHRSFGRFVRDELDSEFYVGVPNAEVETRVSAVIFKEVETSDILSSSAEADKLWTFSGAFPSGDGIKMIFNEAAYHRAELPAVNGITNARSLARIYALLIGDVHDKEQRQKCLLSERTLQEAVRSATPAGEPDQNWHGCLTAFSKSGFQIHGECFTIFKDGVFGFSGYGGSCAFAYPSQQLAFAYVCNQLDPSATDVDLRSVRVIQAVQNILDQQKE